MKKLKRNDHWFVAKFMAILITVSLIGCAAVAGLEVLFGIVPVFISFVVIVSIGGVYVIILQIKQRTWNPKINSDEKE